MEERTEPSAPQTNTEPDTSANETTEAQLTQTSSNEPTTNDSLPEATADESAQTQILETTAAPQSSTPQTQQTLSGPAQTVASTETEAASGFNPLLIVIIISAVIFVSAAVGLFFLRKRT